MNLTVAITRMLSGLILLSCFKSRLYFAIANLQQVSSWNCNYPSELFCSWDFWREYISWKRNLEYKHMWPAQDLISALLRIRT